MAKITLHSVRSAPALHRQKTYLAFAVACSAIGDHSLPSPIAAAVINRRLPCWPLSEPFPDFLIAWLLPICFQMKAISV